MKRRGVGTRMLRHLERECSGDAGGQSEIYIMPLPLDSYMKKRIAVCGCLHLCLCVLDDNRWI
jgi:hypothetical protein